MSGTNGFSGSVSGLGRDALDVPVAALAALAVAFATFVVPADQLASWVASTGLPEFLPAAEPPLGNTARLALGGAGAVGAFLVVFGLLRLLGRKPVRRSAPTSETPRVRRRDLHPDAPTRKPISATLEFGEPGSVTAAAPDVPAWLSPAQLASSQEEQDDRGIDLADFAEPAWELAADPDPVSPTFGEPALEEPSFEQPDFEVPETPSFEAQGEEDSLEPLPAVTPESQAEPETEPVAAWPIYAPSTARSETIAQLMERLERGLARRQPASESLIRPTPSVPAEASLTRHGGDDDRLQSAIDSLQRLASRQG